MKVLFLDVDGVLNSYRTCELYGTYNDFDPVAVKMMNVLYDLGVKFVLSSSWRLYRTSKVEANLGFMMYDVTPVLGDEVGNFRGDDVEYWLRCSVLPDEVTHYCCVDDGNDFYDYQNLVRTTMEEGFLREHFWKVLKHLDLTKDFDAYMMKNKKQHTFDR